MPAGKAKENSEDTVACPVEGCDAEPLKRGLHMHVWQSDGHGHGKRGEVPDDLDLDGARKRRKERVSINYPDKVNLENVERLDTYTGEVFKGKRGLMIHLGQKAGQDNIPNKVTEMHDGEDFPIVRTDDDGNIVELIEPGSDDVPSAAPHLPWTDTIPKERVVNFIEEVENTTGAATAEKIREALLEE